MASFEDRESSVPQAGHVVSPSPPPPGSAHWCKVQPPCCVAPRGELQPPKKHHGALEPVAALELHAVGTLGAAR